MMVRLSNHQAKTVLGCLAELSGSQDDPISLIVEQMKDQLDNEGYNDELIDTIADLIAGNKSSLVLHGNVLKALRAAILSPRELARFKALSTTGQGCCRCGKEIINGEMTSIHNQAAFCTSCMFPMSHACPKCKRELLIPKSVYTALQKIIKECPGCAAAGVLGAAIIEAPGPFTVVYTENARWEPHPLRTPPAPPPQVREDDDELYEPEENQDED